VVGGRTTAESVALDGVFTALWNGHRREMVRVLGQQPVAIHRLAETRGLWRPAIHKHIGVLDGAGLIKRHKRGRTTFLALDPAR
jgi:predicted transcriptional regulator